MRASDRRLSALQLIQQPTVTVADAQLNLNNRLGGLVRGLRRGLAIGWVVRGGIAVLWVRCGRDWSRSYGWPGLVSGVSGHVLVAT